MQHRRQMKPNPKALDWRDPEMPVIREYLMQDGTKKTLIDPDYEHRYREHMIKTAAAPDWRSDPTYNMRKK